MTSVRVRYGEGGVEVQIPDTVDLHVFRSRAPPAAEDVLGIIARALDDPIDEVPLAQRAQDARSVAIVVPDGTRPAAAGVYLLPLLSRLARAGLGPVQLKVIVARGIHPATARATVEARLGAEIQRILKPVQSAPDTPGLNETIGDDPELGPVRVHRHVAQADLVILTGIVQPHHLAGFGGGPKALVPGVAERATVLAAHRLTLPALVRPDGSIRSAEGTLADNAFYAALLRTARAFGRTFLLNVVLGARGEITAAVAGEVGAAHAAGVAQWQASHGLPPPSRHDLVVVGTEGPGGDDLIQAHKALLRALPWAHAGAPIVWLARARHGPGHPDLLPWFAAGKLSRHLAALRRDFHPYGLTAYSMRRIAADHPVHIVSEMSRDLLRPMGLLPFTDVQPAFDFALSEHKIRTCAVLA